MKQLKNTFSKDERLCSEKDIETLYSAGTSFLNHPVVCYYLEQPGLVQTKILVSVSKKKFKLAVDRNLIKRRLKEAYRVNKRILEKKYHLAFVYVSNEKLPYHEIEKAIVTGLRKI